MKIEENEIAGLDSQYEKKLGAKLAVIEELRHELGKEGIECPGVLVIGAQSAGKSSVLERLSGISFPRGENTCTRFPTIVQLQTDAMVEHASALVSTDPEFKHAKPCSSMTEIRQGILDCTAQQMMEGHSIANMPIHIRYVRKVGPVMTLIDLPGITHVDARNEAFDIHAVTSGMVEDYVKNENMVVLVVIPANDDFGNSEALRIAQSYDKDGHRTIGVVSKCDLVPESSDIIQKIRMTRENDVKLALGYVAVKNKGPTEDDVNIEKAEQELFATHRVLRQLQPYERGYTTLSKKIVELQSSRVDRFIPEVRKLVRQKLVEAQQGLKQMGHKPKTVGERRNLVTSALISISHRVEKLIHAEDSEAGTNIATKTLEFSRDFAQNVRAEVPDCLGDEYHKKIVRLLKESAGYSLPNFFNDEICRDEVQQIFFQSCVPREVSALIQKLNDFMESMFNVILKSTPVLLGFPELANVLLEEIGKLVLEAKGRATRLANAVVHSEEVQLFTQNEMYMNTINEVRGSVERYRRENVAREELDNFHEVYKIGEENVKEISPKIPVELQSEVGSRMIGNDFIKKHAGLKDKDLIEQAAVDIEVSIRVYAEIVMKRLFDTIPMLVRSVLVIDLHANFQVRAQQTLDDERLQKLFDEAENIQRQRDRFETTIANMKMAERKLLSLY